MLRAGSLAACLFAAATVAVAATTPPLRTATAVCATRIFTVSFDPKRQVVVSDGRRALASASFATRTISSRCRRAAEPKAFVDGGLGPEIRAKITFRCMTTQPIRIHVNPIRNRDSNRIVGSALDVGLAAGKRFRTIVAAVLKNKGDPAASSVYRAATYCKLGA